MPTQVEKLRKFQGAGVGGGTEKHALEWKFQGSGGSKAKVPSVGGGGGVWIFSGTTHCVFCGKECMKRLFTRPMTRVRKPESGSISDW